MSNMVVNTNVLALNSHRAMKNVGNAQAKASARLASGLRVNTAADDAAGLAISEKMRAQIRGLDQASRNAQDGISLVQTAEGGLTEINNILQRIRELTVQGANDIYTDPDRQKIENEVAQLTQEIKDMSKRVEFNAKSLLAAASGGTSFSFQVGANGGQSTKLTFSTNLTKIASALDKLKYVSKTTGTGSTAKSSSIKASAISAYLSSIDAHLASISSSRATLGTLQNRLEFSIKSLEITSENLSASESRIRDADMAKEMMALTQANVLQQAATSMLAQANQAPQNILQLLR